MICFVDWVIWHSCNEVVMVSSLHCKNQPQCIPTLNWTTLEAAIPTVRVKCRRNNFSVSVCFISFKSVCFISFNAIQISPRLICMYNIQVQGQHPLISSDVEMRIRNVTHSVPEMSYVPKNLPEFWRWIGCTTGNDWTTPEFKIIFPSLLLPLHSFFWTYFLFSKGTLSLFLSSQRCFS